MTIEQIEKVRDALQREHDLGPHPTYPGAGFCYALAEMEPADAETMLKAFATYADITPEDIRALQIGIAYCRVYLVPGLREAMTQALGKQLYAEFNKNKEAIKK